MSTSVCMFVSVSVCLSARISPEPHTRSRVGSRNHVLDGAVQISNGKGQFSGVVRDTQKHQQSARSSSTAVVSRDDVNSSRSTIQQQHADESWYQWQVWL